MNLTYWFNGMGRWILAGTISLLFFSAVVGVTQYYRGEVRREDTAKLEEAMLSARNQLQIQLQSRQIVADDLAGFLQVTLPDIDVASFDKYARWVLGHAPRIRALESVDRSGIIRNVYPLRGNEAAVKLNLMTRPARRYVLLAKKTRTAVFSNPVVTAQGSYSIIIRSPLFVDGRYLGLAQAVFDVAPLLGDVSSALGPKFAVRLGVSDGAFMGPPSELIGPTVTSKLQIGGTVWNLVAGWRVPPPRPSSLVLALIWSAGLVFLLNVLFWVAQTDRHILGLLESVRRKSADLAISQERYRTLVETADDIILQMGLDGRLIFANSAYRNGPKPTGSEGDRDAQHIKAALSDVIRKGTHSAEYSIRAAGGELSYRFVRMKLIEHRDGTPRSVLAIVRDITEQKRLEERNARLQAEFHQVQKLEAVGRLAAGIAHDFNNIIMAVNGNAELIQQTVPEDKQLTSMTDAIIRAGSRAAELVRQLLTYSRGGDVSPEIISLNEQISQMKEILRRLMPEDIEIHLTLAPDLWNVVAAPSHVQQIILNLSVNAGDAMPDGGALWFETSNRILEKPLEDQYGTLPSGEYVQLIVTDDGIGMSAETKHHLFEPFYSTKVQGKGTGLGLATVHGIVQGYKGHVSVNSEMGIGSAFIVLLPHADSDSIEPRSTQQEELNIATQDGTILLAEDDYQIREIATQFLEEWGYTVVEAEDGQRALELALEYPGTIDLLVTDIIMPGLRGQELASRMRTRYPHLRVVYMSGYTGGEEPGTSTPDGAERFLQKPFTLPTLIRTVIDVLDDGKASSE